MIRLTSFSKTLSIAITLGFAMNVFAEKTHSDFTPELEKIYTQLSTQATKTKALACEDLVKHVHANEHLDNILVELIINWKKAQTTYMLGDLDSDKIDIPNYIDVFHKGNEKLDKQLSLALKSDQEAKTALFKNSTKSINALELLIAKKDKLSAREQTFAKIISANLCKHFTSLDNAYQSTKPVFLKKQDKAVALLLNALIDSTYKLKEWRIGDIAGFTRKYEGKPDVLRAEYPKGQHSMDAIRAILATHHDMINAKDGVFAQIITKLAKFEDKADALDALAEAQKNIEIALKNAEKLQDIDLSTSKAKKLYDSIDKLHDSYFVGLVRTLDVVAKILEADGD